MQAKLTRQYMVSLLVVSSAIEALCLLIGFKGPIQYLLALVFMPFIALVALVECLIVSPSRLLVLSAIVYVLKQRYVENQHRIREWIDVHIYNTRMLHDATVLAVASNLQSTQTASPIADPALARLTRLSNEFLSLWTAS
jgi:hypothetical protein